MPQDYNSQDQKEKRDNTYWQAGLSLFVQISGWLVAPLVAALFLGNWLDQKFNTKPWWLFICLGVAFVITIFGLIRETLKFSKKIEEEARKK
jgi:F0F1-type ATP synthase assembly protein I